MATTAVAALLLMTRLCSCRKLRSLPRGQAAAAAGLEASRTVPQMDLENVVLGFRMRLYQK